MARVKLYERAVNAVHIMTHTGESNTETQGGMKIKEEFIDETISTNTMDNHKFLRSRSKICDGDKSSLTENNDVLYKHVNRKRTESMSDNHSEDSSGAELLKIVNLKSRSTKSGKERVCDTSSIPRKKRKYCDKVSANNHTNASKTMNKNFNGRKKRRRLTKSHIFLKNRRKRNADNECNVCFITFKNSRNRRLHYQYYTKIGIFKCTYCNECFSYQGTLRSHILMYHCNQPTIRSNLSLYCNFCNRPFKVKSYLQSHLFHTHNELIYSNTVNETKKSKISSKGVSRKNDTLRNDIYEESCSSNPGESKELSILNKDYKQSPDDNTTMSNKLMEEHYNEDMPLLKKLRQPTLNEYLQLYKRKRTTQLDTMKDGSSIYASSDDERIIESKKPKLSEHNRQSDIPTGNCSNDVKQIIQVSTLKQSEKHKECSSKEPFVKLHADVETMKCFLESLPVENVKSDVTQDQTNNTVSSDHDIRYRLRPVRAIRFLGHFTRKYVFKKFPHNSTAMEHCEADLDITNSEPSKTTTVPPKFRDVTITLERCDKKRKNYHSVSTTQITSEQESVSSVTEPNVAQSKKSDIRNDVMLKKLEVSLERLETEQTENNLELEVDAEKQDGNNITCGMCKKSFPTKQAKRIHVKSSHVAYMSSICNARYSTKHKLLLHYLREHTFRPNQCCICNEICDPTQLKQHLTYHCLKYFQNENDQYQINVDIRCSTKSSNPCFKCGKEFPTHILWSVHDRYCRIRGEVEEVQQDLSETNMSSEVIPKANYNEDVDESTMIFDESTMIFDEKKYDASCELPNNKSVEESNKIRTPADEGLINNEEPEIIEEPTIIEEDTEINGSNQNPLNRKTIFIVENIVNVDESQPVEFPKTNNSTANDQNTANTQLNVVGPNGKTYPCDICGKRFQSKKNLEQHIRSFSRVTDFCPLCNTAFSSKRFLQTHIAAAHVPELSKNYDFHCVFCNQGFIKKYDLRPHVLHLHGRQMLETIMPNFRSNQGKDDELDNGNATCNVCNLAFETLDRYVEHRMYYYKNHKFKCSICFQEFQGMYMYHHHNKLTHYPEDKRKSYSYTCNICKEGFNHELHFHSHNMHVHSNEESSSEIPKENLRTTDLRNNQKAINMEEDGEVINLSINREKKKQPHIKLPPMNYSCKVCQFKCTDANYANNHELFYTNDGDFKCDLCSRRCKTIYLLDQHKSLTHVCRDIYKEFTCNDCGEVLTSTASLRCHKKHFHGLLSLDNVKICNNCGQTFSSSAEYKKHQCKSTVSTSTEKYIYRCFYCDLKFISLDMIQTHIIHVHFSKLLDKHAALKSDLFIISEDKTQNKSIPQLIDQVIVSRNNLTRSFQQSGNDTNNTSATQEAQDKVAVEPTPDQLKPLFLIDNETKQKASTSAITASGSEANIPTMMEKGQDNQAKDDTSVSTSTESTNRPKKNQFLSDTFNISLEQMLDGHSIFSTGSTNKSNVAFTNVFPKPVSGPIASNAVATIPRSEEIPLQKRVSVNDSTDYICPLCLLQYPSLMYFHAHLRYAHVNLIRNDLIYPQLDQLTEKIPAIECLLCPRISTDEKRYKRHLRHSHSFHLYLTNSKETSKTNNASTSSTTLTNSNTRSKSPEVITVEDDDDDDSSKNSLTDRAAAETSTEETKNTSSTGNENFGKLKVKSFAKIIENLAIDRATELLNTPKLNSTRDDVPTK
ncbi:uncharacterized protein LOC116841330 isoform X1 [Odontomachus brunneus]|uniref:uncharacterized protein LOC116841330 isoform X1 n=1 Tax=Odontomachus brunneus TaxID=486640 RepID=UPI0013F1BE9E|nr:uncharacterized protein LOC116841330 isoform X1 [Odontomachus brunneus]XP_032665013.1 uncharacterized protein LOC116841330 isoform X1 [Odontomachus brunneus]